MNTIQQLSQIPSQLPDTYQQDLLAYAQDMLNEVAEPTNAADEQEQEQKMQQLILDRYITFKQSGDEGRPVNEVINELRTKYGV